MHCYLQQSDLNGSYIPSHNVDRAEFSIPPFILKRGHMNILSLYESVCYTSPIDENLFIEYLNRTIDELSADIKDKYLCLEATALPHIEAITDGCNLYDEYRTAVLDNILYFASGDTARKTDFVAHADQAYKKVWKRLSTGKFKAREVW